MKQILVAMLLALSSAANAREALQWDELPPLPSAPGQTSQPGLAGAFSGVHEDALIIAGGANFPDGLPWSTLADGTSPRKIYHRDIYVLTREGAEYEWTISDVTLPHGTSYGVSIPTERGLLCVGGEWREYGPDGEKRFTSDALFMIEHLGHGKVKIAESYRGKALPPLPEALSSMAGALMGDVVYVAGGSNGESETNTCLSLDLSQDPLTWHQEASWAGPPRSHAIAAVASDGFKDCFYLFSGRYKDPQTGWQFLTDAWKFDGGRWTRCADVGTHLHHRAATCVMAGTGIKVGVNHIAVLGGASGTLFRMFDETMPAQAEQLRRQGKQAEADALAAERIDLYTNHPGFSRDILAYHTITDSWYSMGTLPESEINGITAGSHVTTNAVKWGDDCVIPSGEVRPGVRSPRVWIARPVMNSRFGWVNYAVLGGYLCALVLMGFYFSRRENSTDDFFKAGGRVPWWAAGLSIFGTQLSAITFMAIPAKSFSTDWRWFIMNMTIIMVAPVVVFLFLPFYRRLHITTAYEYIEKRFNLLTRVLASGMFILFQLARIGIVLYLPSIALSVVTGVSIEVCITVMALLSIAYTVMGGIEAVIWTDVIQVIVLLGGALLVLCVIPFSIQGGWNSMVDLSESADKLRALDFHFHWKSATFWVLIFGGLGGSFYGYACDQAVIQRYLTTKTEKDAAKGIWAGAVMAIPATLIFFGIGTALFAFFKNQPEALNPIIQKSDAIFPWYIVTQLPIGVSGLLIAGIFAAAMSSLDSSMNSVATAFTTDFYRRLKPGVTDHACLKVAKGVTAVIGLSGMALALAMTTWNIDSLWQQFSRFIGLFGGGLAGLFILAVCTERTSSTGALVGLLGSACVQAGLRELDCIHDVLFSVTGMVSCIVVGYGVSLIVTSDKDIDGLTLYSLRKAED